MDTHALADVHTHAFPLVLILIASFNIDSKIVILLIKINTTLQENHEIETNF